MTPSFIVRTTPHFERLFRKFLKRHADLGALRDRVGEILKADPHNRTRRHDIKKLEELSRAKVNIGCDWVAGASDMTSTQETLCSTTAVCGEKRPTGEGAGMRCQSNRPEALKRRLALRPAALLGEMRV